MTNSSAKNWHPRLLTVGHSNHELDRFLALLRQAGVTALADVRSHPYSKRLPHFNGPQLAEVLDRHDITYVFLGQQLGGRPRYASLYDADGRVNYEQVRQTSFFKQGLDRVRQGTEEYTVALMCSEADPLDCHRGLMITPALAEQGIFPGHLFPDGTIEATAEMEDRLLQAAGKQEMMEGLFAEQWTEEERRQALAEAYRFMARRKAYRLPPGQSPSGSESDEPEET